MKIAFEQRKITVSNSTVSRTTSEIGLLHKKLIPHSITKANNEINDDFCQAIVIAFYFARYPSPFNSVGELFTLTNLMSYAIILMLLNTAPDGATQKVRHER